MDIAIALSSVLAQKAGGQNCVVFGRFTEHFITSMNIYIIIIFHLADAFLQSDLQKRNNTTK